MIGRTFVARIPTYARQLAANDVLCRISAPADGIILVKKAWFGQDANDNLNEAMGIALVRLSDDGSGGASVVFEERAPDEPAFGGSGVAQDADNWTAQPTVANTLDEFQFNLAGGFEWAPQDPDDYILVPTSARVGLRILTASSASMSWRGGLLIHEMS